MSISQIFIKTKKIFIVFITIIIFSNAHSNQLAIKAGYLLDVSSGEILENQVITIKSNRIIRIDSVIPKGVEVIDLSDKYVVPGLIDMHTHLIGVLEKSYFSNLFQSPHRAMIGGVVNAKITLMAGFTSVRNVGAPDFMDVALKNAIDADEVPGPRMRISGPSIGITGGHCDSNYLNHSFEQYSDGVADGPWEIRKRVRNNVK